MMSTSVRMVVWCLLLLPAGPAHAAEVVRFDGAVTVMDEYRLADAKLLIYHQQIALAHHEWLAGRADTARQLLTSTAPEHRSWEFEYLSRLFSQELRSIVVLSEGKPRGVRHVTFSPDGKRLAAAADDLHVKLWDVESGEKLLDYHDEARTVEFSPDGKCLVTSLSHDVTIRDATSGRPIRRLSVSTASGGIPLAAEYTSDGTRIAAADSSHRGVRMWDLRSGDELFYLDEPSLSSVFRVSPDATQLAVVERHFIGPGVERGIAVFDATTGEPAALPVSQLAAIYRIEDLAFSPDGRYLAAAGQGAERWIGCCLVLDAESGQLVHVLQGHQGQIHCVRFSPDGRLLATAGEDGSIRIWNVADGRHLSTFRGHRAPVRSVAFSPDGMLLASGGNDGTIRLWDMTTTSQGFTFSPDPLPAVGDEPAQFSPNGEWLIIARSNYDQEQERFRAVLHVWDVQTGGKRLLIERDDFSAATAVAASYDGERVAASLVLRQPPDQQEIAWRIMIWNTATGELEQSFDVGPAVGTDQLAFSPDGQRLARIARIRVPEARRFHIGGVQNVPGFTEFQVQLWDVAGGKLSHSRSIEIEGSGWAERLSFSPDGHHLATSVAFQKSPNRWDGMVLLLDGQTAERRRTLMEPDGYAVDHAFRPDGKQLAVAIQREYAQPITGQLTLWDVERGRRLWSRDVDNKMGDVVFSPDGELIVSVGAKDNSPGEFMLWDAGTGRAVLRIGGWPEAPLRIAFHAKTRGLATMDGRGLVRLVEVVAPPPDIGIDRAGVEFLRRQAASVGE